MSTIHAANYGDGTGTVPASTVLNGSARSFISLIATTNVIEMSANVASVTDQGAGDHRINFTNSMVNARYCVQLASDGPVNTTHTHAFLGTGTRLPGSYHHRQFADGNSNNAGESIHMSAVFGDLA